MKWNSVFIHYSHWSKSEEYIKYINCIKKITWDHFSPCCRYRLESCNYQLAPQASHRCKHHLLNCSMTNQSRGPNISSLSRGQINGCIAVRGGWGWMIQWKTKSIVGCINHYKQHFPCCSARQTTAYDVSENKALELASSKYSTQTVKGVKPTDE